MKHPHHLSQVVAHAEKGLLNDALRFTVQQGLEQIDDVFSLFGVLLSLGFPICR